MLILECSQRCYGRMDGRKEGRKKGRKDGSVTIPLRNFVGEGIEKRMSFLLCNISIHMIVQLGCI